MADPTQQQIQMLMIGEAKGWLSDEQSTTLSKLRRNKVVGRPIRAGGSIKDISGKKSPIQALLSEEKPGFFDPGTMSRSFAEALPMAGTVFGGAAGTGLGATAGGIGALPGGVAGAGLGAAGGQALMNRLLGLAGQRDVPQTMEEELKSVGTTGAIGATSQAFPIGPAIGAIGRAPGQIASKIPGLRQIGPALERGKRAVGKFIAQKKIVPTQKLDIKRTITGEEIPIGVQTAERGIVGTKRQIMKQAQQGIKKFGGFLDDALEGRTETIDPRQVVKSLDEIKAFYRETGEKGAEKLINRKIADFITKNTAQGDVQLIAAGPGGAVIKKGQSILTAQEATTVKRAYQSVASKTFGKDTTATASIKKEFAKRLSTGIKKEIERVIPDQAIKEINRNSQFFINLSDSMAESLTKDLSGGGLRMVLQKPATMAGGAGIGALMGGVPGALVGAATPAVIKSMPVGTFVAAQLLKSKSPNIAAEMMTHPEVRNSIFKAIGSATKFGVTSSIYSLMKGKEKE